MNVLPRPARFVALVLFVAAGLFGLARPAGADTLLTGQAALDWASSHACHYVGGFGWNCTMNDAGAPVSRYTATNLAAPASFPTAETGSGSSGAYRWELDPVNNTRTTDSWYVQCAVPGGGQPAGSATGSWQTSCGTLPSGTALDVDGVLSSSYTADDSTELTYGDTGGTFPGDAAFSSFSLSPSPAPAPSPDGFSLAGQKLTAYVALGVYLVALLAVLGIGVTVLTKYVRHAARAA